jgi:DNA-binding XRE family transcriptional regulator
MKTLNLKRRPRRSGIRRLLLRPQTWRLVVTVAKSILRIYYKMNQSTLAADFGISKSYLCEIEVGKKKVTLDLLNQYSSRFDVPLSALFLFSEEIDRSRLSGRAQSAIALGALSLLNKIASGSEDKDADATET